jgi:CBS domain-containing protein
MVLSDDLATVAPSVDAAIDQFPLVVSPTTSMAEAIVLMSQTRGFSCSLAEQDNTFWSQESRSSCVLVVEGRTVVGILTERDVVRLTASGIELGNIPLAAVMVSPVITLPERNFREIFAALFLFRRYRIRHLVIVDDQNQLVGTVSHESIRQVLRPSNLLKLRRVAEVMTPKAVHAPLTASVTSLAKQMADSRVSCVVVVATQQAQPGEPQELAPVGIVTERDIVQFQALGLNLAQIQAQIVMSSPLFLASPEDSLWDAHQAMQRHRVQRLVVSWNWGKGLGIITQTSLLRVFDPIEMLGVYDTLRQNVPVQAETKAIGQASSRTYTEDTDVTSSDLSIGRLPSDIQFMPSTELETRLWQVCARLRGVTDDPESLSDHQQRELKTAIAELQALRRLVANDPEHRRKYHGPLE